MAELKTGTVVRTQKLSSILGIFSVMPENGGRFPSYEAGQYIALRRNNCKLTKKAAGPDGQPSYVPDALVLDRVGPV
jgi:hypothetical protein